LAYLLAPLIERHDRSRFEVTAVSFSPDDGSEIRARMVEAFDCFEDVSLKSDRDVALALEQLQLHIAVDLMGHTLGARPGILACRPVPINVNFLGYPGTMGAEFIDYILADRIALPFDQQPYYAERIVHLPDCFFVRDTATQAAPEAPSRLQAGLPERGVVFCCFNASYKFTAALFEIWMRLLASAEGSVLWLSQANDRAVTNLRDAARARGIGPERILFAPRVQSVEDHLARHKLADLFLDTLPYNAHSTANDALWAGVPAVTCVGRTFAGRVAGSMLHAIGLPELATSSLEEYEAVAKRLAAEPSRLQSLRRRLDENRRTSRLFDLDRYLRHIEGAYTMMWERWQHGDPPDSFSVPPRP
jgi:predicted O-linked N-acetylglucosamine transferase (SPINDLY family)